MRVYSADWTSTNSTPRRRGAALGVLLTVALVLVWAAVVLRCVWVVDRYEATPGHPSTPPELWPPVAGIARSTAHPTLVMLAHPHCPCTRASLGELAGIMRSCTGQVDVFVFFLRPGHADANWEKTDLWATASAIPGARAIWDKDGAVARQFGAATSGAVVLYGADGHLLFSGGITRSRGMFGGNDGRETIISLVHGESPRLTSTPVYGCQLLDSPGNAKCCKRAQREAP